jgi:hypothetical protein
MATGLDPLGRRRIDEIPSWVRWLLLVTVAGGGACALLDLWLAGTLVQIVAPLADQGRPVLIGSGIALWVGSAVFLTAAVPLAAALLRPAAVLRASVLGALIGAAISAAPGALWLAGVAALLWRGLPNGWLGTVSTPWLITMTAVSTAPCFCAATLATCLMAAGASIRSHDAAARAGAYHLGGWRWATAPIVILLAVRFILGGLQADRTPPLPPNGDATAALAHPETRDAALDRLAAEGDAGVIPVAEFVNFWWARDEFPNFETLQLTAEVSNEVLPSFARVRLRDPSIPVYLMIQALPRFGYRGRVELCALLRRDPWRQYHAWTLIKTLAQRGDLTVDGTMPNTETVLWFAKERLRLPADDTDAHWAAIILGQCGPAGLPPLLALLRESDDSSARASAVAALGYRATVDPQLIDAIALGLGDPHWEVRKAAAGAVARLGARAEGIRERLIQARDAERTDFVERAMTRAIGCLAGE